MITNKKYFKNSDNETLVFWYITYGEYDEEGKPLLIAKGFNKVMESVDIPDVRVYVPEGYTEIQETEYVDIESSKKEAEILDIEEKNQENEERLAIIQKLIVNSDNILDSVLGGILK